MQNKQIKMDVEEVKKRVAFISKILEISIERAHILNRFIADIPTSELSYFFRYRIGFHTEKGSKELITLNAYRSYIQKKTVSKIKKGEFTFEDFEEMVDFIRTYFAGSDLTKGAHGFKPHTIISVTQNGRLQDTSRVTDNGFYVNLTLDEEITVYEWLFLNQTKIGYTPLVSEERQEKLRELLTQKLEGETGIKAKKLKQKEIDILSHNETDKELEDRGEDTRLDVLDLSSVQSIF